MSATTVISNVNVFDGKHETLLERATVLVEGNKIKTISTETVAAAGSARIDGGGRTLMPGLIDAHWHTMFNFWPISTMMNSDFGHHSIAAALNAKETLLRGFTTVRDLAGNCMPVKKATDEGLVDGPRIYPCLGALSQTSGHFDFRGPNDVPEDRSALLPYT